MAYAYCNRCGKSFRYRAEASGAPRWLKEIAQTVGRGEQAVLLCFACWVEPEIGDLVEVINPPHDQPDIWQGAEGRVVATEYQEGGVVSFEVESLQSGNVVKWRCILRRRDIKAVGGSYKQTAILTLHSSGTG